jgi:hypothetical protein
VPPAVPKRDRGRPRNPVDYSRLKQSFRKPEEFEAFITAYPHQQAICGYWWRLRPKIDLGLIGAKTTNIHKTTDLAEMTRAFAADRWGRGMYMVKFIDANLVGEQEVARCVMDIDDPDVRDSVYDINTLVLNHSDNLDEVARQVALGLLERTPGGGVRVKTTEAIAAPVAVSPVAVAPTPAATAAAPSVAADASFQTMLLGKLVDRLLMDPAPAVAVAAPVAAVSPAQTVRDALELAKLLQPAPAPAAAAGGLAHELETYERVGEMLDSRIERLGGAAVAGADSPAWVDSLLKSFSPLIGLGAAYLSSKLGLAGAPAVPVARLAGVAGDSPSPLPAAAPESRETAGAGGFLPSDAPLMDRVQQVADLALIKREDGVAGDRFAAWLCGFYPGGGEVFDFLCNAGGAKGVIGFLSMMPRTAHLVADPLEAAALEGWLGDFFSYGDEEQDLDEEAAKL